MSDIKQQLIFHVCKLFNDFTLPHNEVKFTHILHGANKEHIHRQR